MPKKKKPLDQVIVLRLTAEDKKNLMKAAAMVQENNPDYVDTGGTVPVARRILMDGVKHIIQAGGAAVPGKEKDHEG